MRIAVMSDSHNGYYQILSLLDQNRTCDLYLHLGDGEREFLEAQKSFPDHRYLWVKGNCDFASLTGKIEVIPTEFGRILACHGDQYQVKTTLDLLEDAARGYGAQVALFGHTHEKYYEYRNGIHLFNPGSLGRRNREGEYTYGIVELSKAGIVCFHRNLR